MKSTSSKPKPMKTIKALLAGLSLLTFSSIQAQTRDCATMEVLANQIENDSATAIRLEQVKNQNDSLIKSSGRYIAEEGFKLPALPGYQPTGDIEIDRLNWAKAKQDLYAKDPELYKELTRLDSPSKNMRN